MFFILIVIGILLLYGAVNSFVELIPFMIYLLFYLGVIVLGSILLYSDVKKIDDKSKQEKHVSAVVYLTISLFFPTYIFKVLGIIINDVYSARFIGMISTVFLLVIFYFIRGISKRVFSRTITTGVFIIVVGVFFIVFSNFGYRTYSQQVSARAGEIEEYIVEKNTPLLVEISVEGNQKSTLFGDFFVTEDKIEYYYMGKPINHHFALKKMPANSKLCVTGRDLYEKGNYIEVYCKENGLAGYIKEEKLTCIVDYKYITNRDAPIYGAYEKEVNTISAETGEAYRSTAILVNSDCVVGRIPKGTEVVLGDGPEVPFGYEHVEVPNGQNGYIKKDDLDIIPIPRE